jgi:hypothetical protein
MAANPEWSLQRDSDLLLPHLTLPSKNPNENVVIISSPISLSTFTLGKKELRSKPRLHLLNLMTPKNIK